ncbi:MAG: hypothetical protein JWN70_1196 [Planctomycetaceae bacterium]|nr:hypothetical protein [Planctomycetaceae bacterium]
MVRLFHALAALVVLAILPGSGQLLEAQTKKKGETISGTVVSIEKAKTGRSYTLKMKTKSDETEYDVPLVPRTQLIVAATGDKGFLQANANVGGVLTALQNPFEFECDELNVYVGNSPPPGLKPKADADNNATGEFEMSGKIVELQAGVAQIQCGQQPIKLTFHASTVTVNVKFSDAALIKEGDVVDVEGTIVKGKQTITANTVMVTSAEPITYSEYSAAQGDQKGKSAKTAVTKAKTKKDASAGPAGSDADPFGVLGNKPKAKTKTSGGAVPPAGKEPDPFGVLKNKAKTKAKAGSGADAEMEEPAAGKPGVKKAVKGAKAAKSEEKAGSKE